MIIKQLIKYLKSSQYFIQNLSKLVTSLISILKTTGLSKISTLKAFKADNNKVVSSKANEMVKKICLSLVNILSEL